MAKTLPVNRPEPSATRDSTPTLFSFGYWGAGGATRALADAVNEAEAQRGFAPPLWVDIRISRSVRAAGFRERAFSDLLGSNYVWMPELGNVRVQERSHGIQIANPHAAVDLLQHALDTRRRVIFFCACELPIECHRHEVGCLVKRAATEARLAATVVEWPGGEPSTLPLEVSTAVLRAVARGSQITLAVPKSISIGEAAAVPWATRAELRTPSQSRPALIGPARFSARGAHFPILRAEVEASHSYRQKNGYNALD